MTEVACVICVRRTFYMGRLVITPGALQAFEDANENPAPYLERHLTCDWGDLDPEDKEANDRALKTRDRLLSAYHLSTGTKVYVITEHDRSATTVLLPDEY